LIEVKRPADRRIAVVQALQEIRCAEVGSEREGSGGQTLRGSEGGRQPRRHPVRRIAGRHRAQVDRGRDRDRARVGATATIPMDLLWMDLLWHGKNASLRRCHCAKCENHHEHQENHNLGHQSHSIDRCLSVGRQFAGCRTCRRRSAGFRMTRSNFCAICYLFDYQKYLCWCRIIVN